MIVGLEPFFQVEILIHPAAARVQNQKRHFQCLSFFQITFNEPRPLLLRRQRYLGITIARQINEIEAVIDAIKVDRLGSAWSVAREREPRYPCYRIDKAGLTDIASAQKRNLRQPIRREVFGFICAKDEFCFQVYYTRRGECARGVIPIVLIFCFRGGGNFSGSPRRCRTRARVRMSHPRLSDWKSGREEALDLLTPVVCDELRRLAKS